MVLDPFPVNLEAEPGAIWRNDHSLLIRLDITGKPESFGLLWQQAFVEIAIAYRQADMQIGRIQQRISRGADLAVESETFRE